VTSIYFGIVIFTTRPKLPFVVIMLVLNLGLIAFLMPKVYDNMHDYQKKRVETFLNPEADKSGSGYQVFQSKIAIGSGGLVGKGYLQGSQKALSFLPMRHTDFIYSVVGEEFGLLGALTVILLYGIVILRGYRLAVIARDGFAGLMAVGITTALFFHIMVNMLMTVGWAPVTGVPLPFLSYGGTALIVNCVQIGLLQNVALRRREY
jgi:rod shape determining protein RodA